MINTLYETVYAETVTGINTNWELAVRTNQRAGLLCTVHHWTDCQDAYKTGYLSNNQDALRRFVERKDNGLAILEIKVWAIRAVPRRMKLGIEALKRGTSATKLV